MATKKGNPGNPGKPGKTATANVTVRNVSNTGQSSTSTQRSGATGDVRNTTTIRTQGDPGFPAGQQSDIIKHYRKMFGL